MSWDSIKKYIISFFFPTFFKEAIKGTFVYSFFCAALKPATDIQHTQTEEMIEN